MTKARAMACGLLLGLLGSGCLEVGPPQAPVAMGEEAPRRTIATAPAPAASAPEPAVSVSNKPFRLAWTAQTKPFSQGLALSKSLVAALGSSNLTLLEMRSGAVLKRRDVCATFTGAFRFLDEKRGVLVCERSIQLLSVPDLEIQGTIALPGLARAAAFCATLVAVAFEAGPVRLYANGDWSLQAELPMDSQVRSLALSDDGKLLAVGLDQGDVLLFDRAAGAAHRVPVKTGLAVDTLQLGPEAKLLFAGAGPTAAVWDVASRSVSRRFQSVSNVLDARWLSPNEIVSAGRDGVLVLDRELGGAKSLAGGLDGTEPAVSLAATRDGKVFCAAERDGKLACYARGKIPTRAIPVSDYGADDSRMAGRVASFVKKRLTVKGQAHAVAPSPGTAVRVLRYTESTVGTVRSARWIELVTGQVVKVNNGVVHLLVGGAPKDIPGVTDPLAYDTPVRLVWKRAKSSAGSDKKTSAEKKKTEAEADSP